VFSYSTIEFGAKTDAYRQRRITGAIFHRIKSGIYRKLPVSRLFQIRDPQDASYF